MKSKFRGFSLAELMISLLIISIVLSAAVPVITKKAGQQRELIWRWTEQNHVAFSAVGANQSVIIGLDSLPMEGVDIQGLMTDKTVSALGDSTPTGTGDPLETVNKVNLKDIKFSDYGDKLAILKRTVDSSASNFVNSHISFFNMSNGASEATAEYGGRLAMDAGNIALGMGTLQSINKDNKGENTAVGHFSLLRDTEGYRNTALGKKSLSYNDTGSYNTAVGFASLFFLGDAVSSEDDVESVSNTNFENTAVGTESLYRVKQGSENTALGSRSLKNLRNGDGNTSVGKLSMPQTVAALNNTVIGSNTLSHFVNGSDNIAIGYNSCGALTHGNGNICIGSYAGENSTQKKENATSNRVEDYNGIYIGGGYSESDTSSNENLITKTKSTLELSRQNEYIAPLISGHTKYTEINGQAFDQEVVFNARKVKFQPYNGGNNNNPLFMFEALYGSDNDGYGEFDVDNPLTREGKVSFNFRDTGDNDQADENQGSSIRMDMFGLYPSPATGKMLAINAYNPYGTDANLFSDIAFNGQLVFDFPKTTDTHKIVNIGLYTSYDTTKDTEVIEGVTFIGNKQNHGSSPLCLNEKFCVTHDQEISGKLAVSPIATISPTEGFYVNSTGVGTNLKGSYLRISDFVSSEEDGHGVSHDTLSKMYLKLTPDKYEGDVKKEDGAYVAAGLDYNLGRPQFRVDTKKGGQVSIYGGNDSFLTFESDGEHGGNTVAIYSHEYDADILITKVVNEAGDQEGIGVAVNNLKTAVSNLQDIVSDIRLKNVFGDYDLGLKEISQLETVKFTYKDDKKQKMHAGVIAQQLQKIMPDAVITDKDGYLRINREYLFFAMVNAVKELYHQIQDFAAKITGLEKRITELETQNKLLKEQNAAFEKRFAALEKQQEQLNKKQTKLEARQTRLEKK